MCIRDSGYTVCYRETHDKKYLNQALKTFQFMKTHPRLPKDLIPYWDMDAHNIPNEPRDASSASCIASALYEISTMDVPDVYKRQPLSWLSVAYPSTRAWRSLISM